MNRETFPINHPDFSASEQHVRDLQIIAVDLRIAVVRLIQQSRSGHLGGSLSLAEIFSVLYFSVMRNDPTQPTWRDRDPLILSKGHAAPILYVTLAKRGFFPKEWLATHRKLNSLIQGHPDRKTPGVEAATGSLGQGLSIINGMMLAARLDKRVCHAVAVIGDGECDEGQVWEAAMSAAHHHLGTVAILDRNGLQIGGTTEDVKHLEPLADKWRAFGWQVIETNGHSIPDLLNSLQIAWNTPYQPTLILAHTVKGKGVTFMENQVDYHARIPNNDGFEQALMELEQHKSLLSGQ